MTMLDQYDKDIEQLIKEREEIAPRQQLKCTLCNKHSQIRSIEAVVFEVYEDCGSPNGKELRFIREYFICPKCGRENHGCEKFLTLFRRFRKHFKSIKKLDGY